MSSQSWHQIIWYHEGNCEGANYGVYFDGKKIGECVIPNTKNLKIPLQINTKKSPIHIKALSIFDEALTAEQAKKMYQHTSFEPQTLPNATDYLAVSNNMLSSYKYQKDLLVEENEPQINKVEQPTEKTFVDMSKAISVSFWLKTDSTKVKSPFRIGEKDDQIGLLVDFVEKEEELTFRYKPLSQHSNMVQSNEINDGKWHHVVTTLDTTEETRTANIGLDYGYTGTPEKRGVLKIFSC